MSIKTRDVQTLDDLNEVGLAQMAGFAEQDRDIAEEGMALRDWVAPRG